MLRNALFATASRQPNADVGVVINGVYAEVEGMHFDPELGCLVLELDEEALSRRSAPARTTSLPGRSGRMLPKLFALTRNTDDEVNRVVGYGMVLPDGCAHSVSWPARAGASVYSTNSAEEAAELRRADLLWLGDPT